MRSKLTNSLPVNLTGLREPPSLDDRLDEDVSDAEEEHSRARVGVREDGR